MSDIQLKTIVAGPIQTNCYILRCPVSGSVLVIDPGEEPKLIASAFNRVDVIVYTHGHFDHCGAGGELVRRFSPEVLIHSADAAMLAGAEAAAASWGISMEQPPPPTGNLLHGLTLEIGKMSFQVLHTPGHSPGSVCLYGHGMLFSGDTLFQGSVGRTDLPGSSGADMETSLKKLTESVAGNTLVYPGHGGSTTMKRELAGNPFLRSTCSKGFSGE